MDMVEIPEKKRQRARSKRSLQTRERILDAAERVFAEKGFAGASLRDIAGVAGVAVGLVHHHGEGKERLFAKVVGRRARPLAELRIAALELIKARGELRLETVLESFFMPLIALSAQADEWKAYARLVAMVSADPRWASVSRELFDPTAQVFVDEIAALYPGAARHDIASGLVFSVSAMLGLITSQWRIAALSDGQEADVEALIAYCAGGIRSGIGAGRMGQEPHSETE